ncbi:GntR family transcriptional regulator [Rossellomorea sp. y25]|uniref:GntR family transcriptional regulator n=1 Tax=Rossellomorea sp. y25 TaxID=3118174 RepID=UPI00262C0772|nr:GntR family transcriptional regulator [uncultured Rossellomorea sp.]
MIEKDNRLPLYYQLMDELLGKIESGELAEQEQLPSERELCESYKVSRTTVRQTMQELEKGGYIYKVHGKGSYVSPKTYKQSLVEFYSFTEEMKKIGKQPSTKVVSFEKVPCESTIGKKMNLTAEDEVYKITRLRLADRDPMIYETSFVPVGRFQHLTKEELEITPMYEVFRSKYDVNITRALESFNAVSAQAVEADMLTIEEYSPCLRLERITFEENDVIEYTISIARGDKFTYTVELK